MTSKMFKAALAATTIAVASFGATSAHAADATATARARILEAVTISVDATSPELAFGTIAPGANAANLTVSNAGVRGPCPATYVCTGTTSAAGFNLTGANATVVKITLPASIELKTPLNDSMTATLTSDVVGGLMTLSATGTGSMKVGGTLQIGAGQAAGNYTGTLTVSAVYN